MIVVLLSNQAHAADQYERQLNEIRERSGAIDTKMAKLGFVSGRNPSRKGMDDEARESGGKILQIYAAPKILQAQAGRVIIGKITNRLVVAGDGSPAIIELAYDQGIFSGLSVLGKAAISSSPGRLLINCERLVLRSGKVIPVEAVAMDSDGAFGLAAQVVSGKALAVAGAMAGSFVSGLAASQQSEAMTPFGFTQTERTGKNAVLQGLAQSAADQSKRLIDEATKEKPVLIVETGTQVGLYFNEEVRF
ncbi:MAG: hypothetical protein A2X97_02205 [Bdellovibrionales bacterium GWA1_52_35]|nr:MAG: hypothetical protein A2X97_02205 [Bdellovibrionales bacterium GWA1_52_35]